MNETDRLEKISNLLKTELTPKHLDVIDESDEHIGHAGAASGAGHYYVNIISEKFKDKSLIERHRMVYNALSSMMPDEIHALRIKAAS